EHLDGVLDGIAVGQLIRLAEDVAALVEQDCLGGRRTAVDSDEARDRASLLEHSGRELPGAVCVLENIEVSRLVDQALASGLGFFFLTSEIYVVDQLLVA